MSKKIIIAEKPSAMKNMAHALGGKSGVFNGEEYEIVNLAGHLYSYPQDPVELTKKRGDYYKQWRWESLPWNILDFNWKKKMNSGAKGLVDNVKAAVKQPNVEVVIATDDDPSGEGTLLAVEVLEAVGYNGPTTRMFFADESAKEIQKAFKNRVKIPNGGKDGDWLKADCRAKFDYLSMQLTRAASLSCKDAGMFAVLRQGRLKSVMVYLVGEQYDKWKNYKKIPYYTARYRDENGHIYKRKPADEPHETEKSKVSLTPFKDSDVVLDKEEKKFSSPGKLLDLAGLSSILAARGYKPKQVLATYQKMYEDSDPSGRGPNKGQSGLGGYVSYPRTEDKKITIEQYNELLPLIDDIADIVGADKKLLTHRKPRTTHIAEGMAHGANRPGKKLPKDLKEIEDKYGKLGVAIYTTLAKNFLAMFGEDYEYNHQIGHIKDHPEFIGTANVPISMGYKAIFDTEAESVEKKSKDEDSEKDGGEGLPLGKRGKAFVHEGFPPRPTKPTIKWLMKQLEKYNVGTGATRTSTVSEITDSSPKKKKVQLMNEQRGALTLTEIGNISYRLLEGCQIASPEVTEKLFNAMDEVGKGKLDADKVINSITPIVIHDMKVMQNNAQKMKGSKSMFEEKERFEGVYAPTGETISFNRDWSGHHFSDDEIEKLMLGEEIEITAVSSKSGKAFRCTGKLAEGEFKGRKFWGFQSTGFVNDASAEDTDRVTGEFDGEEISFKREWGGHTFTDEEVERLLDGKEIEFEATSKAGKTYTAHGKLAKQEFKGKEFWGFKPDFN